MVAALTAADLTGAGLDPTTETILTTEETEAIGHAFARWLGVGPGGVIAFPFTSLQPMPRPRRPSPNGCRRLPPGITAEGARHPAWWLDARTTWQDPDESDLAYGVRLALELEHRGVCVPGDGPIDALAAGLGWVIGDPVTDARVATYATGAWDPDLCRFELRPRPTTDGRPARAELQRRARQLLRPRLALLELLNARRSDGDRTGLRAELALVHRLEGDLDGLIEDVRRCGQNLCRQAGRPDDRVRLLGARQSLASAVDSLIAALEDLDDASQRCPPHRQGPIDARVRRRQATALMGAVYAAPGADASYRDLHERLDAWRLAATGTAEAARGAIDDLLRACSEPDPDAGTTGEADPHHRLGDVESLSPFPD